MCIQFLCAFLYLAYENWFYRFFSLLASSKDKTTTKNTTEIQFIDFFCVILKKKKYTLYLYITLCNVQWIYYIQVTGFFLQQKQILD